MNLIFCYIPQLGNTRAQNMYKIFSLVPSKKTCHQKKVFTFRFLNDKIDQNIAKSNGFLGCNWKVKTYFVSVFSGDRLFFREWEKIFYTHSFLFSKILYIILSFFSFSLHSFFSITNVWMRLLTCQNP